MITFHDLVIEEGPRWKLYLHQNQYYLGRAYAWLVSPGQMQRLSQLSLVELAALRTLEQRYEEALRRLWQPDHMNYAWLGNEFESHKGHGHMHLIPRYARPVVFGGHAFIDEKWGKNYASCPVQIYPNDLMVSIRDALRQQLE